MKYDRAFFDAGLNRKNTDCAKWDASFIPDDGTLPLWVADWDFACAEPIVNALKKRAEHPCYGYPCSNPDDALSFCNYWKRRHNTDIKPEETYMLPCVVTGLKLAVRALTKTGEKAVIMPPLYGPFLMSLNVNDRVADEVPLICDKNARYSIDFDELEKRLQAGTRCVLFCNPHNPVSRFWSREELQKICDLCNQYGSVFVCDEIHADFVYKPNEFVSALTLEGNEKCVVTFAAASKTFNVPGLQQAMAVSHNPELLKALSHEADAAGITSGNVFALAATRAAYNECDDWLDSMLSYLDESRQIVADTLPKLLPKAILTPIEATCLCWIDLRAYAGTCEEISERLRRHKVFFNSGDFFDKSLGQGFIRLNFACPHATLREALKRLGEAMNE